MPPPWPGPGEVLVEVHAAIVDAGETVFRAGKMRRVIRTRFPRGLGSDVAGQVTAVGSGVRAWNVGDAVLGLMPHLSSGALADYLAVPAQWLARAPKNLSPIEAAALPASGTTAMTALTDRARLRPGEQLLVRATGGVGSVAVQLGKGLGAHVTAPAGARNLDWIIPARPRRGQAGPAPVDDIRTPSIGLLARSAIGGACYREFIGRDPERAPRLITANASPLQAHCVNRMASRCRCPTWLTW
ncbi:NAD(P)-dependent alcohol dehydrogenase [Streptomyces sp. NBC_01723]|uniref:NAD(P)-dependent alcohol dehydrogenase n=1 Tax=Streptomyces sp. NBC_01723 TaxID=2975921 RepID=UPI002E38147E|nr:NAD(P)-dependent alcohol dehydrogenase [Streptomyces sp. NBC_01723]